MQIIPAFGKTALAIILGLLLLTAGGHTVTAKEDTVLIQVSAVEGGDAPRLILTPPESTVGKNGFVIWLNAIDGQEINVEFADPDAVASSTADHQVFSADKEDNFSARYMPYLATASLRFIKTGTFTYSVKSFYGRAVAKGKLIVR